MATKKQPISADAVPPVNPPQDTQPQDVSQQTQQPKVYHLTQDQIDAIVATAEKRGRDNAAAGVVSADKVNNPKLNVVNVQHRPSSPPSEVVEAEVVNPPVVVKRSPAPTLDQSHEEACREMGLVPSFGNTLGFGNKMVTPQKAQLQAWASLIGVGVGAAVIGGFVGFALASTERD